MTDMVNGEDLSQQNSTSPVMTSQPQATANEERTFKQSEVNDIVGKAKHEAVERYKRDSTPNYQSTNTNNSYSNQNIGLSRDEIKRTAAEEFQRLRNELNQEAYRSTQEQEAQRIATEFFTKLDAGKSKFNDFDQVMKEVEYGAIPHIVQLANMIDNTPEVMYELAKNPAKIASIQQLISISPKLALSEMKRLSQSIKDNEEAANFKAPNQPLSQMRPSNTGMDNGALTVKDYKARYKV